MRSQIALAVACLLSVVLAHPTKYLGVTRNETCYNPDPAPIWSYHIHLIFWSSNKESTSGAMKIQQDFKAHFADKIGADCLDMFDSTHTCFIATDLDPYGPFLTANWSFFVMPADMQEMTMWMMQHRQEYSVLVHPNTGCELEDHTWWTMWGGEPYALDNSIFSFDQPFPWPEWNTTAKLQSIAQ